MHRAAGMSSDTQLLWILLANCIVEQANLSGPVNNLAVPANICSIENILSH